jgi:hypothetical protein
MVFILMNIPSLQTLTVLLQFWIIKISISSLLKNISLKMCKLVLDIFPSRNCKNLPVSFALSVSVCPSVFI